VITIDRLRFLLKSYDDNLCTKHEVVAMVYDDIFKEIVEATADGNDFMVASSACYSNGSPPTVKLEVDYHPSCLSARRKK